MVFPFPSEGHTYRGISPSEDISETDLSNQEKEYPEIRRRPLYTKPLPWIVSTVCLFFLQVALILRLASLQRFGTFSTGFVTEFDPATDTIEVVEVLFQGTLAYTDEAQLYATSGPDKIRYVGKPTEEVDRAWAELIGDNEAFQMTKNEASTLPGDLHEDVRDGFIVGLTRCSSYIALCGESRDALSHISTSCGIYPSLRPGKNEIRKLFDSEHYFNTSLNNLSRLARIHADHCLNHIRQSIQCHMDLTPHPMVYFRSANVEVMNFDQVHTCRDISKLRDWVKYRKSIETISKENMNKGGGSVDGPFRGYISPEAMELPWTW